MINKQPTCTNVVSNESFLHYSPMPFVFGAIFSMSFSWKTSFYKGEKEIYWMKMFLFHMSSQKKTHYILWICMDLHSLNSISFSLFACSYKSQLLPSQTLKLWSTHWEKNSTDHFKNAFFPPHLPHLRWFNVFLRRWMHISCAYLTQNKLYNCTRLSRRKRLQRKFSKKKECSKSI